MIAIGLGANSRAQEDDFVAAIDAARTAVGGVDVVATLGEAGFSEHVCAAARGESMEYRSLTLEQLRERGEDCVTRSPRSLSLLGVPSLAEAAALVAAGGGSRLVLPRQVIGNVTIAAARSAGAEDHSS